MKTVVEGMLPARFLTQHAVYMQTCAHIENAVWGIIRKAKGLAPLPTAQTDSTLPIKKATWSLLTEFKKCTNDSAPPVRIRVLALHTRLKEGLTNRNLAAHGAWYLEAKTQTLRVEHYFEERTKSGKVWQQVSRHFGFEDIDAAIEDADNILRELIDLRDNFTIGAPQREPNWEYYHPLTPRN